MTNSVQIELEAEHLDYITTMLQQRPWAEANPILVSLATQIRAHQERAQDAQQPAQTMTPPAGNGAAAPARRGRRRAISPPAAAGGEPGASPR